MGWYREQKIEHTPLQGLKLRERKPQKPHHADVGSKERMDVSELQMNFDVYLIQPPTVIVVKLRSAFALGSFEDAPIEPINHLSWTRSFDLGALVVN